MIENCSNFHNFLNAIHIIDFFSATYTKISLSTSLIYSVYVALKIHNMNCKKKIYENLSTFRSLSNFLLNLEMVVCTIIKKQAKLFKICISVVIIVEYVLFTLIIKII